MVEILIKSVSVCVFPEHKGSFLLVGANRRPRRFASKWATHVRYLHCYRVWMAGEHRIDPDGACNQHQAEESVQC